MASAPPKYRHKKLFPISSIFIFYILTLFIQVKEYTIKTTNIFALLLGQFLNKITHTLCFSLSLKIIFLHENIEFYESFETSCLMRWFRILGTNYWNVIREDHAQDDSLSELVSGSTKSLGYTNRW